MTPAMVHVLLTLVAGPRHGYAILQEIDERASARLRLGPSSLYWILGRLDDAGLVAEAPEPDDVDDPDARRRYWRLTADGRERLRAELEGLADLLSHAQARRLLSDE